MPNVILPNLGIELPDVGSDQDTWGDILNADLQKLDNAVQYDVISKTLAGVDVTLTDVEAASAVINLTGTLTANVNVIVPATPVRVYLVRNQTSGAFTVTVKTAAGTGTAVQQGTSSLVYSDGTNIIQGATSLNGSFSAGNTSVANLSYTGTLTGGTGVLNIGSGQVVKDAAGNLGLGVTPSAWATLKSLDVSTWASFFGFTNQTGVGGNTYFDGTDYRYKNTNFSTRYEQNNDGRHLWFTAPSGTAGTAITFTQALTLFQAGQLLLGATSLSTGAFAEFTSTTGALIVPRMTTAQRDALGVVANGAIIYNTTTNKMNFRENGAWVQPTVTAA